MIGRPRLEWENGVSRQFLPRESRCREAPFIQHAGGTRPSIQEKKLDQNPNHRWFFPTSSPLDEVPQMWRPSSRPANRTEAGFLTDDTTGGENHESGTSCDECHLQCLVSACFGNRISDFGDAHTHKSRTMSAPFSRERSETIVFTGTHLRYLVSPAVIEHNDNPFQNRVEYHDEQLHRRNGMRGVSVCGESVNGLPHSRQQRSSTTSRPLPHQLHSHHYRT